MPKRYVPISSGAIGADTSDATATADDIRRGKSAYIASGKVSGRFDGVDSSDATATANDIIAGKTAYVNNQLVTGTFEPEQGGYALVENQYGNSIVFMGNYVQVENEYGTTLVV